jgi:hypothetical protein
MHLLAKGVGNIKYDAFLLTLPVSARGMFLGTCGGSTRDDTCADARKQESNVSNMLLVGDQQDREAMANRQIGCATLTRSLTSCLP